MTWLTDLLHSWGLTWTEVIWSVVAFVVTFSISIAEVTFLLVILPPNYFHSSHPRRFLDGRHQAIRVLGIAAKNLLGLFHIAIGVVMSLPGVPGQGILTILIGLMLMDLPGVRRLERALIRRPRVYGAVNAIRARFGKPPLVIDGPAAAPPSA